MDYLSTDTFLESNPAPVIDSRTDRKKTCWAVFCGNDMSDKFRNEFQGAKIGGFYFGHDYKTLHMTKHMMRRCEITPLTIGYDFLNTDSLGGDTSKTVSFQTFNQDTRQMETQYAYECFPRDELDGILSAMQGPFDMGIREIESLRGEDAPKPIKDETGRTTGFTPSKGKQMQLAVFPDWSKYVNGELEFFPTIASLREYLLNRRDQVPDDVQEVIDVMLASNDQFDQWANERLSEKGNLVKAGVSAEGRVHSWNKDDFRRFDQTGIKREDLLRAKTTGDDTDDKIARLEKMYLGLMEDKIEQKMAEKSKEVAKDDLAPETTVSVAGKQGTIIEKKGGGYYAVLFDDGTEGNFRPAQFD